MCCTTYLPSLHEVQTMHRLTQKLVLLVFLISTLSIESIADEVFLVNGDRLSGKVVSKTGEKLVLKTTYAGELGILWADIERIVTDTPVKVTLDDQSVLKGELGVAGDSQQAIKGEGQAEAKPLPLQEITAIGPVEVPRLKFSGMVNLGFERDRGNTDEDNYYTDGQVRWRWPDDRLTFKFDGELEKSNNDKISQEANLYGDYDHFLNEKLFLTTGLMLEHDKFADLTLRTTVGAGAGYQFIENDRTNLSTEVAPGYVWENFDNSENDSYPVALWRFGFDHYVFESWKLQAFYNHRFTQSLDSGSDYIYKAQTGLRVPIFDNLQATLQYNFDRDNAPADDAKKNDHEFIVTGGYRW